MPGQKYYLQKHIGDLKKYSLQDREVFWKNIKRAAKGLQILHSQGILHRKLDEWSILTENPFDYCDFQLTGFEWSMRLSGALHKTSQSGIAYSFVDDWKGVGEIAAKFLVKQERITDTSIHASDVSSNISSEEAILLRKLLQIIPCPEISYADISKSIDEILTKLIGQINNSYKKFKISFSLGQNSKISLVIRNYVTLKINTEAIDEQVAFIKSDLANPRLVKSKYGKFYLIGESLSYEIKDFQPRRGQKKSNWAIAYCEHASTEQPVVSNSENYLTIGDSQVEIYTQAQAEMEYGKATANINTWKPLINKINNQEKAAPLSSQTQEFWLIQTVEYLLAILNHYPITASAPEITENGTYEVKVTAREDERIESIRKLLGIKDDIYNRVSSAIDNDNNRVNSHWIICNEISLNDSLKKIPHWQYNESQPNDSIPVHKAVYSFLTEVDQTINEKAFLVSTEHKGNYSQYKRKAKALKSLGEHSELISMILDPRAKIKTSYDDLQQDSHFEGLDNSKQKALEEIISTLPLFLLQGPPGVGKTRLIKELIRRRYDEDSTTRFLLTAQSNSAVDHLLKQANDLLTGDSRPLVVRCGNQETEHQTSNIHFQCKTLVDEIISSPLAGSISENIRDRLIEIQKNYNKKERNYHTRTIQSLVLRSANFVFSTTNSPELERLIEEQGQFDWSIVEEAGKATGGELISPLLLSHRRLLIGDHKQLPPFNSDLIKEILINSDSLKEALKLARPLLSSDLLDSSFNDTLQKIIDADEDLENDDILSFSDVCRKSISKLFLFESLISDEVTYQTENPQEKKIAVPLTVQHRMHPAIAEIVSKCFYKNELHTAPEKITDSKTLPPPVLFSSSHLDPAKPVHWIDMPWIQDTIGKIKGEELPRYTNTEEIDAIQRIIKLFKRNPVIETKPTIAVLSPYAQQVKAIKLALSSDKETLSRLQENFCVDTNNLPCHTVDSFQGNEADIVLVSLTRNNNHTSIRSSLGFLTDHRRANVLLSRARKMLFILGSLNFLNTAINQAKSDEDKMSVHPLSDLLEIINGCDDYQVTTYSALSVSE